MASSKSPAIFFGAIGVAIIAIVLCVYYITPNHDHVLVTHDAYAMHPTHAFGFAAIAVVSIIAALVTRPKSKSNAS